MTVPAELPQKEKELARTLVTELEQTGGDATKVQSAKAHLSNELNSYPYEERDKIALAMQATYLKDKSVNKNLPDLSFTFCRPPNMDKLSEVIFSYVGGGCSDSYTGGPEHLLDIYVRDKSGFLQEAYDMPAAANEWRSQFLYNKAAITVALDMDKKDTDKRFAKVIASEDRH
jgi:hypothetical protein